mmetsp:Transcript_252/g.633  ORF Transcript_252/g.633 Transcript_252/m.633 type:complete len:211 (-) Transcript_252:465-1097(-)
MYNICVATLPSDLLAGAALDSFYELRNPLQTPYRDPGGVYHGRLQRPRRRTISRYQGRNKENGINGQDPSQRLFWNGLPVPVVVVAGTTPSGHEKGHRGSHDPCRAFHYAFGFLCQNHSCQTYNLANDLDSHRLAPGQSGLAGLFCFSGRGRVRLLVGTFGRCEPGIVRWTQIQKRQSRYGRKNNRLRWIGSKFCGLVEKCPGKSSVDKG